ncbi:MAG: hypothetical protein J0I07_09820 [Myxococcales bacterium]|nr:hypothetical protein [Myxococcales bacterium]
MRRAFLLLIVLSLAVAGVGCPCTRGAVNASPELRWWLFSSFGASKICPEMLKRGVPLKLPQLGAASVGRFFPSQCNVVVDDAKKAIVMSASGTGYVMMPFTRRVGFYVGMSVEYLPDFRMETDAMYVWGKFNRFIAPPDLRILGVENPVVNLATQTPFGNVATVIGNGIVEGEIGRGFTVVRQEDGDDFAIGHLDPPAKPKRQFQASEGRVVLASDLTSVYTRSREFLGPFEVAQEKSALYLRARASGAPISYAIVERSVGENWRRQYETAQPLGPPPGVLVAYGPIAPGEAKLGFPVNPGTYYIVLENTAAPPLLGGALGEPVAQIAYSVEVGDRR